MSLIKKLFIAILVVIPSLCMAQENKTAAKLQFEPSTVDFGKIPYKSKNEYTVKYWNNSKQPIVIKNISTECNCTKVKWNRAPLMPGDTTSMIINYSADSPGQFYKAVKILSTDQPREHRIIIRGDVTSN